MGHWESYLLSACIEGWADFTLEKGMVTGRGFLNRGRAFVRCRELGGLSVRRRRYGTDFSQSSNLQYTSNNILTNNSRSYKQLESHR